MSHMNTAETGGLQGAALRGMREHNELIKKGRLWLRDSPEKPIPLAVGFLGACYPLSFVCAHCIGRLRGRGCHVEQLATRNVFAPELTPAPCDLCAHLQPPDMSTETQQALGELVQCATKQMEWEAGFISRYQKQCETTQMLCETMCTDLTIQASLEAETAYKVVADRLYIKLPA